MVTKGDCCKAAVSIVNICNTKNLIKMDPALFTFGIRLQFNYVLNLHEEMYFFILLQQVSKREYLRSFKSNGKTFTDLKCVQYYF